MGSRKCYFFLFSMSSQLSKCFEGLQDNLTNYFNQVFSVFHVFLSLVVVLDVETVFTGFLLVLNRCSLCCD